MSITNAYSSGAHATANCLPPSSADFAVASASSFVDNKDLLFFVRRLEFFAAFALHVVICCVNATNETKQDTVKEVNFMMMSCCKSDSVICCCVSGFCELNDLFATS